MSEQLLNGADVGAALEQVGGEGMAKGMCADVLREPGTANGHFDGFVDDAGINVMGRVRPERGATDRSRAGNTYCQPPSLAAAGYFRARA